MKDYNENLLLIKSPRGSVGGPWAVISRDMDNNLGIVALSWDGNPRLGIRWVFKGEGGYPNPRGYPAWHVLQPCLNKCILDQLKIRGELRKNVDKFLGGDISGEDLTSYSEGSK